MKRNLGIDLLRLILMFMVVLLHILGHGGILTTAVPFSANYIIAWLIETACYCAVNCYAIITGYVYISSQYRPSSMITLWLHGLVYSLGLAICAWIIKPDLFSLGGLYNFTLPVSRRIWWYLSAYAGLFIIIPFLNAAINAFSERHAKILVLCSLFTFTVLPTLSDVDYVSSGYGYSTFWLAYLYVIGAFIRKYHWGESLSAKKALLTYLVCVLASWLWKLATGYYASVLPEVIEGINFVSYTSPTIVLSAIALFLLFSKISPSETGIAFIQAFSPAAFGVYLIHEHPYISGKFIYDRFSWLNDFSSLTMLLGIFMSAIVIFVLCILVDFIRVKIFQWLGIKKMLSRLDAVYSNVLSIHN